MTRRTEGGRRTVRASIAVLLLLSTTWVFSGCAMISRPPPAPLGGLESYRVNGRTYVPLRDWEKYEEVGVASWYGGSFHGRKTASGERFDAYGAKTAAHKTLPFNVCAHVKNLRNGRSVVVRINDRGPFARGRLIDLSRAAATEIGIVNGGVARVHVEAMGVADTKGRCRKT